MKSMKRKVRPGKTREPLIKDKISFIICYLPFLWTHFQPFFPSPAASQRAFMIHMLILWEKTHESILTELTFDQLKARPFVRISIEAWHTVIFLILHSWIHRRGGNWKLKQAVIHS